MKLFDSVKKIFTPAAKQLTTDDLRNIIKRVYEAAQPSDQFKRIPFTTGPNQATQQGAEKLRAQARHLDENHDLSISILDTLVSRIVGDKIKITPMVKTITGVLDVEVNDQIRKQMKAYEKRPEVTRMMSIGLADRLTCRTWLRDGEALNRYIIGKASDINHPSDVSFSIELIEPDFLPFLKTEQYGGGRKIIQGIELNRWGAAVNYHILKQSPYEIYPGVTQGLALETFPVSATMIKHIKFVRRMSQIRGVSIFHGIMRRLESIKDYEESEQVAARVAASMTSFIQKDMELGAGETSDDENRDFAMEPGMIYDKLRPGETVGMVSSDRPNTGLLDFRNALLKACAGGTMSNFSSISKTYDGTYSSQRQELVESKANYDILRDQFMSEIKVPTTDKFLETAYQFRVITPGPQTNLETLYDVEYSCAGVPWIDPLKEINAFKIAKEIKIMSQDEIIRSTGRDPETVKAEIEDQQESEPEETNNKNQEEDDEQEEKDNKE